MGAPLTRPNRTDTVAPEPPTLSVQLMAGDAAEVALARRIAQLAASFDFESLRALADSLSAAGDGAP